MGKKKVNEKGLTRIRHPQKRLGNSPYLKET